MKNDKNIENSFKIQIPRHSIEIITKYLQYFCSDHETLVSFDDRSNRIVGMIRSNIAGLDFFAFVLHDTVLDSLAPFEPNFWDDKRKVS